MMMSLMTVAKRIALAGILIGSAASAADIRLQGAGATFPNPLYQRWVSEYQKSHPDVKIDYQSIGSGGGIKAITDKTVQFAGSDAPMSSKELDGTGGAAGIVEIPSTAGAVVPAYNIPGNPDLKFTGEILAQIFMGKITNWNDPAITKLNPGISLPGTTITPVYRTDGSGTNFIWSNYLATQSAEFKSSIGTGKQVKWPVGQGGKGSEGVTAVVQQTPGAIAYVESNYAMANKIAFGSVQNKNGKFVKASAESISAAGEGAVAQMHGNILAVDIWNQPGDKAYPVSAFTYLIVYKDLRSAKSAEEAKALADFLWWAAHDGQKFTTELDYSPLASGVQAKIESALNSLEFQGTSLKHGGM
jgi:phosphate transport system substrate-binding protein